MLGSKGSDAKYFSTSKKGENAELQADLNSTNRDKIKEAVKKVIASMTVGKDVSSLFTDVIKSMPLDNIELKKLIYLYIINYARSQPDKAILVVNTFQKDARDRQNPLIRALAIRTMGCIRVDRITQFLCDPLQASLKDSDPYVRKTAAICVAKLYDISPELVEDQGFLDTLREMIADPNHTVVANAVAALVDISESSGRDVFQMNEEMLARLQTALDACTEWGQVAILDCLAKYTPTEKEAEEIVERVTPRLKHANPAVALSAVKVIMKYLDIITDANIIAQAIAKLQPPLITLLSEQKPEIQYVALRNIRLIVQKRPEILANSVKHFFCKYNDPIYVKMEKLEIMIALASADNIEKVLLEFKEYASEVDVDFVRKSVLAIGRCAIKLPDAANKCIIVLLGLIENKVNYVVQQSIVVIRDIFRKYPNRYESIITKLCNNLDVLDEPDAKAAMIWIVGEYGGRIENASELLGHWCETFEDEPPMVQLQLLTAVVKVFLRQPEVMKPLVQTVLKLSSENTDNPDLRDRGYIYWRLLSNDPAATVQVVLAEKPSIEDDTAKLDSVLLDKLISQLSTLASVYHKTPDTFVKDARGFSGIGRGEGKEDEDETPEGGDAEEAGARNADDEYVPEAKDEGKTENNSLGLDFLNNLAQISNPTPAPAPAAGSTAGNLFDIFMLGASAGALSNPESAQQQAVAQKELGESVYNGPEGVEFRVRFGRENNKPVAFFNLKNNSATNLDVVPLRFNQNYFGLAAGGAIPAVAAGQSITTAIPLDSAPADFDTIAANKQDGTVLCAAKLPSSVPKFSMFVPAEILFAETGALEQGPWVAEWRNNASLQAAAIAPFTVAGTTVAALNAKLSAKNIKCLAVRPVNGAEHCFLSGFWRHTPVLAEMIVNGSQVSFNVKASSKKVAEIAAGALKDIVTKN